MINETSLCMGCMNDKTYDGPCRLCGYSDDTPCIPTYLQPKTLLNERYIVGKVISYNGEGATYIGYDTATCTRITLREFMPDTLCTRRKGESAITVSAGMMPLYKTYLSEFEDLNRTLMKSRGMSHLQTVLDVFSENNTAYAVLEYINGISLKSYLANSSGEMSWEQVKELFPPILTTLSLVHGAGIIHRGISLDTIFVTDRMELKLTGFSISAARTTNTEIACEIFAGYAAPEQYSQNEVNGTWTDVYGIAAVMYRCLTGCAPTEAIGRTGTSMLEPMMINRNIPAQVSKVIMGGLRLATDSRIRSVTAFVDKLFEQPKREEAVAVSKQQQKKLKKQKKERAKTIAVLIIAGLVIIAFAVVFAMTLSGAFGSDTVSSQPEETTTAATTTTPVTTTTPLPEETVEEPVIDDANISLPDFTNWRYDTTVSRYEGIFTFVPTYEYTDEYNTGMMYDQSIEAGTLVAEGTQIEVKVSKGRSLVPLPDYADMKLDAYIKELSSLNIKYEVRPEQTNNVPEGNVAKCSKAVGDLVNVESGEIITVYIAQPLPEEEPDEGVSESAESGEQPSDSEEPAAPVGGEIPVE